MENNGTWTVEHLILYYTDRPTWDYCVGHSASEVWNTTDDLVRDQVDMNLQEARIANWVVTILFDEEVALIHAR